MRENQKKKKKKKNKEEAHVYYSMGPMPKTQTLNAGKRPTQMGTKSFDFPTSILIKRAVIGKHSMSIFKIFFPFCTNCQMNKLVALEGRVKQKVYLEKSFFDIFINSF